MFRDIDDGNDCALSGGSVLMAVWASCIILWILSQASQMAVLTWRQHTRQELHGRSLRWGMGLLTGAQIGNSLASMNIVCTSLLVEINAMYYRAVIVLYMLQLVAGCIVIALNAHREMALITNTPTDKKFEHRRYQFCVLVVLAYMIVVALSLGVATFQMMWLLSGLLSACMWQALMFTSSRMYSRYASGSDCTIPALIQQENHAVFGALSLGMTRARIAFTGVLMAAIVSYTTTTIGRRTHDKALFSYVAAVSLVAHVSSVALLGHALTGICRTLFTTFERRRVRLESIAKLVFADDNRFTCGKTSTDLGDDGLDFPGIDLKAAAV